MTKLMACTKKQREYYTWGYTWGGADQIMQGCVCSAGLRM